MRKLVIIGLAALTFLALFFDNVIAKTIVTNQNHFLLQLMILISLIAGPISSSVVSILLFSINKAKRKYMPWLISTLVASFILSYALKYIIARPRPNFLPVTQDILGSSFPSTHAFLIFAPLPFISREYPRLRWVWLAFGVLILMSRVYMGVHFPSDVFAGALLGYLTGFLVLYAYKGQI